MGERCHERERGRNYKGSDRARQDWRETEGRKEERERDQKGGDRMTLMEKRYAERTKETFLKTTMMDIVDIAKAGKVSFEPIGQCHRAFSFPSLLSCYILCAFLSSRTKHLRVSETVQSSLKTSFWFATVQLYLLLV